MPLLHPQLEAFIAVIEEGSFERAAKRLFITPSALSQRIKALEERLGTALVRRETPAAATSAGEKLLMRANAMRILEGEALSDFAGFSSAVPQPAVQRLPILINNDSLATWFPEVLVEFAAQERVAFDIRTDDQDHALESLKNGSVVAAVTSSASPVPGARVRALGAMRYVAVASPEFGRRIAGAPERLTEFVREAPMLAFDRKDELQLRFLDALGIDRGDFKNVVHYMPSPTAMIEASAHGLGWSMAPVSLAKPWLDRGEAVVVAPDCPVDVYLYWQCASIRSSLLERLTAVVLRASARWLEPIEKR